MNLAQKIEVVRKHLKEKLCFGLQVDGNETCRQCHLAAACAPMRVARLTYELQHFDMVAGQVAGDADYEAQMESMSKAKFEAMIDRALNRRVELETMVAKAQSRATATGETTSGVTRPAATGKAKRKGRPRAAKEKSAQVLALATKGMTRQAIATELGISLASVYRILRENR